MKSVIITVLLFLCTSSAWAVCSADGANQWRCTNTGNADADGLALWNFMAGCPANDCISGGGTPGEATQFACGDFVRVEPGAYNTPVTNASGYGARPMILLPQSGCSGPSQKTTFVPCASSDSGSCATSIALVPKNPQISDFSHMWVIKQTRSAFGGAGSINNYHVANNYELIGVAGYTDSDISVIDHKFSQAAVFSVGPDENAPSINPHDISISKYWVGNGEVVTFGQPTNNDNPNAFYTSILGGLSLQGDRMSIKDGTMFFGGFDPRNPTSVTGVTCNPSGLRTICTAPGLAAAMDISAVSCPDGATNACGNGARTVTITGATGSWAGTGATYPMDGLNGLKFAYYISANSVGIDSSYKIQKYQPYHLDSSGFGAWSGSATFRLAVVQMPGFDSGVDPQYSMVVAYINDSVVEGNYIQGIWQYFAGSGGYATDYGVMQAGSTTSSLIFDSIHGTPPAVGNVVSLAVNPNNGQSKWCGYLDGSGIQCGGRARDRASIITSCSTAGSQVTCAVQPYGPDGLDGETPLSGTSCPLYNAQGNSLGVNGQLFSTITSSDLTMLTTNPIGIQVGQVLSIGAYANLAGGIPDTTTTSIPLDNPVIPAGSTVSIDREQMCVTAGGGTTTLTVTRGCNGTTKTIHNSGVAVYLVGGVEQIKVCNISGGTITVGTSSCPNIDGRGVNGTTAIAHLGSARIQSLVGNTCWTQWGGKQASNNTAYIHNTFFTDFSTWAYGKGYEEMKSCKNNLWDGNTFTNAIGNWFIDGIAQTDGGLGTGLLTTYAGLFNCHVSNNIFGGSHGGGQGGGMRGQYYETTNTLGVNGWYENNLSPQALWFSPDTGFGFGAYGTGGGYTHNTTTLNPNNLTQYAWTAMGPSCSPGQYYGDNYIAVSDNWYMINSITTFGAGGLGSIPDPSWNTTPCAWHNATQKVYGNTFIADPGTFNGYTNISNPSTILAAWPGNGTFTNQSDSLANIHLLGTCAFATYTNCGLDPTSPYKGTATDGGDPGADVLQLQDHLNNWSRAAGLITYDLNRTTNQWYGTDEEAQWIYDPSHWTISSTTFAPTFTIVNAIGSCTAHIYTDRARLHEDADTSGGNSACNRSGNTVVGQSVTFVFGHHSALSSNSIYYLVINDGSNVMTAVPIKTTGIATAPTITPPYTLPDGTVGIPYSYSIPATGTSPITFSGTGLPGWASLSSGGILSGTPNAAATTTIHVTATNTAGSDGPHDFSITVDPNGVAPVITKGSPLTVAVVTVPYSNSFTATGDAPIVWTGTSIPPGLTLDTGGNLFGTPTLSGSYTMNITATNAAGHDGPHPFIIGISDCIYSLNPTSASFGPTTITGNTFSVTTQFGCAWTVDLSPSWVVITNQSAPSGPGTVTYTVLDNFGPNRSGTVSISGQTFTVNQSQRGATTVVGGSVVVGGFVR